MRLPSSWAWRRGRSVARASSRRLLRILGRLGLVRTWDVARVDAAFIGLVASPVATAVRGFSQCKVCGCPSAEAHSLLNVAADVRRH